MRALPSLLAFALTVAGFAGVPGQAAGWVHPTPGVYGGGRQAPPPVGLSVVIEPLGAVSTYSAGGTYQTNALTALPTNGSPPYTYSWSRVSGSTAPSADTPTSGTTTWTATVSLASVLSSQYQVTVTDAGGNSATATTPVNFSPSTSFPLDHLFGIVIDNGGQTQIQSPSAGKAKAYAPVPKAVVTPISSYKASYNSSTCNVTLNLVTTPTQPLAVNQNVTIINASGTGNYTAANGSFTTITGTASTTLVYHLPTCTTMALAGAQFLIPDYQNFVNAGMGYVRIPIDPEQVLGASGKGIPYPTSYLQPVKTTAANYNSTTGIVTLTVPASLNILAPSTTTASAGTNLETITVADASMALGGAIVTDLTTPSAFPSLASKLPVTVTNVTATTIRLINADGTPASVSPVAGDTIQITYPLTVACAGSGCGTGANAASIGGSFTTAAGTGGRTVTYQIAAGLSATPSPALTLSNIWQPLTSATTASATQTAGCPAAYISTDCVVAWDMAYVDTIVSAAAGYGLAVDVNPIVVNIQPGASNTPQQYQIYSGFLGGSPTGNLHEDMGVGYNCYGYSPSNTGATGGTPTTCFEGMILEANVALVNRFSGYGTPPSGTLPPQLPSVTQAFFEFMNEPDYKCSGTFTSTCSSTFAYQKPALWNQAIIDISLAIRAIDTTHYFIIDGPSSAKAQNFPALVPICDTISSSCANKVVYSFHKYDPITFVNQSAGASINPLMIYPRPGSCIGAGGACPGAGPSVAIGRPADVANGRPADVVSAFIPAVPVIGSPVYNTSVSLTGCTGGITWNAGTTLSAAGQMQACIKPGGSGASAKFDYYTPTQPSSNSEITIDDLYGNTSTGVNLVTSWAAAGGHTGPLAGVPLFIMVGEIGMITNSCDYRSCRQMLADLRTTMATHGVTGGQAFIPATIWSWNGVKFGFRPKGGGAPLKATDGSTYNDFCLYGLGQLSAYSGPLFGYDADMWDRMQFTAAGSVNANPPLHCSGAQYVTPGLP